MAGNALLIAAGDKLLVALENYFESGEYVKPFQSELLADCVVYHAAAAAVATMAGGVLPGIAGVAALTIPTVAIWRMYIKMSKIIGVNLSKTTLKFIASAALSNIMMNAGVVLASTFIPGASIVASGIMGFTSVYAAGLIFLNLLTRLFKVKRTDIEDMSDDEWKASVKEAVSNINMKVVLKEGKKIFNEMRENGTLENMGKNADISEVEE